MVALSRYEDLPVMMVVHQIKRTYRLSLCEMAGGGRSSLLKTWEGGAAVAISPDGRWVAVRKGDKIDLGFVNPPEVTSRLEIPGSGWQFGEMRFARGQPELNIRIRRGQQNGEISVDLGAAPPVIRIREARPLGEDEAMAAQLVEGSPIRV